MLIKFESSSARVKGLSFHPTRHWILASLHTGVVQLWDYRIGALLEQFEEHEGPTRGVSFHPTQPLFATGGDDYKIKIWNFKTKRCLFTLEGHIDYIRTVVFHHELPWLMSTSDDQTIRIWNWQSRNCLAIITGHNHYIMSAMFHPSEDLIVTASLDQTIRVWEFKSLREKFYSTGPSMRSDMILGTDVIVKFVLEGHDRGVNWASFHPTGPYIVSSADDRTVRLWRYTDSKAWEVETMRGHSNNVSCVIFHPTLDVIVSNSEDKSLRVWDMNRRNVITQHRKENERFWILAAHPSQNLIASGCDTGFMVFKLERERIPCSRLRGRTFLVLNKQLKMIDENGRDSVLSSLNPPSKVQIYQNNPKDVLVNSYCNQEFMLLLQYEQDGGWYVIVNIARDLSSNSVSQVQGNGIGCGFIGRDKIAVLKKPTEVVIIDNQNNVKKKIALPFSANTIFTSGISKLLIQTDESLIQFDVTSKEVLNTVDITEVKRVIWSPNMEFVALMTSKQVTICDKNLTIKSVSPSERIGVKSGVWDPCGVFLYNTATHIKYLLITGDNGTVQSLESQYYISGFNDGSIYLIDRQGTQFTQQLQTTEYRFKLALFNKRYNEVQKILENKGLCGNTIVNYLQDKGFPEIALHFIDDDQTRFDLAIQAGMIEDALQSAYQLNKTECWEKLGLEALKQGNSQIVEMAYQKTRNLDRLSMLYLLCGNLGKLEKMQQIARTRNDTMRIFHNALLRGDIETRVDLLGETGHVPLAYVAAKIHNIHHMLNGPLEESLGEEQVAKLNEYVQSLGNTTALTPPVPIFNENSGGDSNWPLHNIISSEFELLKNKPDPVNVFAMTSEAKIEETNIGFDEVDPVFSSEKGGWGDDIDMDFEIEQGQGGWNDQDIDIPDIDIQQTQNVTNVTEGLSISQKWAKQALVPGQHIAAGAFQQAIQNLKRTAGITNFAPLKEYFLKIRMGGYINVPLFPHMNPWQDYRLVQKSNSSLPLVCISLNSLTQELREGYRLTTQGKFSDALVIFSQVIHQIPLIYAETQKEAEEAKELLKICVEYITCMRLELQRQEEIKSENTARALELSYYMSLCKLQPPHSNLTLRSAISFAYKYKNFITCSSLVKRFLDLASQYPSILGKEGQTVVEKNRKLLAYCQQVFTNDLALGVELPESAQDIVSVLCMKSFTQVTPAFPTSRCPYCASVYQREYKDQMCDTCGIATIGLEALGLKIA